MLMSLDKLMRVSTEALFSVLNAFHLPYVTEGERLWAARQEGALLLLPTMTAKRVEIGGDWEYPWESTIRRIDQFGNEVEENGFKAIAPYDESSWGLEYSCPEFSLKFGVGGGARMTGYRGLCRFGEEPLPSWFLALLLKAEKATPVSRRTGGAALKGTRVARLREELRKQLAFEADILQKTAADEGFMDRPLCATTQKTLISTSVAHWNLERTREIIAVPEGALKRYQWQAEMAEIRRGLAYDWMGRARAA